MIIVDISPFKGAMMCVELGGLAQEMKIYLHRDIVSENGLAKGMEISENEADELMYRNDVRRAKERALYLLEGREYSYSSLFDKLEQNYDEDVCFEVCSKMKELGLLDDRRYAEKLCRQLFEVKKFGRYRVKMEMKMKGISPELAEEMIETYCEENNVLEGLEELVERKYERYLTDRKGVEKVKAALVRKGYSYLDIREVLDMYDLDFDE